METNLHTRDYGRGIEVARISGSDGRYLLRPGMRFIKITA